jgi:hypothetical protein
MDLNELYSDHQVAIMRADGTSSPIAGLQRALGAGAAPAWEALAAQGATDLPTRSLALRAP